jgi:16S rRNA processing protein RimM
LTLAGAGDPWLSAGRVGRAHGLDGSFYVNDASSVLLVVGMTVRVAGRAAEIVARKGTDVRPIIRVASVDDRDAAEALRGEELLVPRDLAPPLEEDEYWAADLEGCVVSDGEREVGVVRRMSVLPSCEVLEVERVGGGELLVPLIHDAVRRIDVHGRRIDVNMAFLAADEGS